jgi:UDP-N-acetylmuramoylalanine--D-glutamate ligase
LIYGLSRDALALAEALLGQGAVVRVVHPAEAPAALSSQLAMVGGRFDISERWEFTGDVDYDVLFVDASYGEIVPRDQLPCALKAQEAGVPVLSVADFVFADASLRSIGITGSAGKTSTASLVAHLLEELGRRVLIATDPFPEGNRCPNYQVIGALASARASDVVVAELTSVYLSFTHASPDVAVVTNLWPDHIEWHGSMDAYIAAKQNLLRHQGPQSWAVLNGDDALVRRHFSPLVRGRAVYFGLRDPEHEYAVFLDDNTICARWDGKVHEVVPLGSVPVEDRFASNVLAAIGAVAAVGADPTRLAAGLSTFVGIPQRRQLVGEAAGVRIYNDGMAGSPVKAQAGLETLPDKSVVLVAGGRASFPTEVLHSSPEAQEQLAELAEVVCAKAVAVVLFGEGGERLADLLRRYQFPSDRVISTAGFVSAEAAAVEKARPGNAIVFAPTYYVPRELRASFGQNALTRLAVREKAGG